MAIVSALLTMLSVVARPSPGGLVSYLPSGRSPPEPCN